MHIDRQAAREHDIFPLYEYGDGDGDGRTSITGTPQMTSTPDSIASQRTLDRGVTPCCGAEQPVLSAQALRHLDYVRTRTLLFVLTFQEHVGTRSTRFRLFEFTPRCCCGFFSSSGFCVGRRTVYPWICRWLCCTQYRCIVACLGCDKNTATGVIVLGDQFLARGPTSNRAVGCSSSETRLR